MPRTIPLTEPGIRTTPPSEDVYGRPDRDTLIEHGYILVVHAHAAVTHRIAGRCFFVRAMDQVAIPDLELVRAKDRGNLALRRAEWRDEDLLIEDHLGARREWPEVAELVH